MTASTAVGAVNGKIATAAVLATATVDETAVLATATVGETAAVLATATVDETTKLQNFSGLYLPAVPCPATTSLSLACSLTAAVPLPPKRSFLRTLVWCVCCRTCVVVLLCACWTCGSGVWYSSVRGSDVETIGLGMEPSVRLLAD